MYRGIPVWLRVVQALHNAPRADDTLWGPGIFTSIEAMPFPVADEDIDSKERVFCQCGSRELQQEARAERLRVGNFFALAVPMRNPAAELHANRVSPSAEVSSLNGGCWRWRVTRAAYAVAQISHVRIELA